jgi:hypothetical protein
VRKTFPLGSFRTAFLVSAFTASLPLASSAAAETLYFTLTGPHTATFALDSSPVPDSISILGAGGDFALFDVVGTYDGSPTTFARIEFITTAALRGGLFINDTPLNLIGPQLFTGTLQDPTFTRGTFRLAADDFFTPPYTLTIGAPVPEPASWALMLLGFAAIGLWSKRSLVTVTTRSHL